MTEKWEHNVAYQAQLAIIQERQRFMETFRSRAVTLKNDARLFEELRLISDEKLTPVMIWPEQGEIRVGYLIQRIGNGGFRVLLCLKDWRMIRVKLSARIWHLNDDAVFQTAVAAQQESDRAINYIMAAVHATPRAKPEIKKKRKLLRTR